jgi:hypothetical protein
MEELLSILKTVSEGGYTWQETIVVGLAILGVTLSILIIVRGLVSIVSLFMKSVDKAIEKINVKSKYDKI